jgi:hypothetical protein
MKYDLSFEKLLNYDISRAGISLNIELRLNELLVTLKAKVDTGSTHCIFERKHAEKLGFNVEAGEPQWIGTSVGSFLTFGHWITLITDEFSFDSMVFFAKDEGLSRNVLGRHGWLDRVIVGINDYDGKLYLSRYAQ